jgi:hypothetical protein
MKFLSASPISLYEIPEKLSNDVKYPRNRGIIQADFATYFEYLKDEAKKDGF